MASCKSLKLFQRLVLANRSKVCLSSRFFHASSVFQHGDYPEGPETLQVKWILKNGTEKVTPAAIGASILQVAHHHGIELEGACEGVCACSTCHVILPKAVYDELPEASEVEEDMLDQAFGLTATSRLGCQVQLGAEHNNMVIKLPKATRNFYVVSPFLSRCS
jgi:ferredoxin